MPSSICALQLRSVVLKGTNRGVWNLAVEVSPERVILRGQSGSFYAKQLAQESIRRIHPEVRLENAIEVAA